MGLTSVANSKHPGLTNAEFAELGRYIRHVADALDLRDWLVILMFEPAEAADKDEYDSNTGARIEILYGKKQAKLWVCSDFRDLDSDRQRVWIVHELCHIWFDGIDTACRELREPMGYVAWNAWWIMVRYHVEHAVNAAAEVIGPQMPFIQWPNNLSVKKKRPTKTSLPVVPVD